MLGVCVLSLSDFEQNRYDWRDFATTRKINFHEAVFSTFPVITLRETDRKKLWSENTKFVGFFPKSPKQSHSQYVLLLIAAHSVTQWLSCSACSPTAHSLHKYRTNSTVCNWTLLTVITQELLLHIQRANVQHIYCTNTVQSVQSATELYLQ